LPKKVLCFIFILWTQIYPKAKRGKNCWSWS